ncbi:hypothetical protein [Xanthomonas axonopodis]|uniref:hypothetical protein n=1 Tax=Xanthomonas axonopodis TaxID=53413 RepID=UPI00201622D8|nr:hypothetical protein [Xanthomonas axonopodis]
MRTDHQLEQFLQEATWLQGYPAATLQIMLDHARYSHTRRAGRIALIAGSVDKLGLLPVAASLFLVMRAGGNPLAMSSTDSDDWYFSAVLLDDLLGGHLG